MDSSLTSLSLNFSLQNLNWSALLIGQSNYRNATDLDIFSIINALYQLKFFGKIGLIVDQNLELLKYKEIRLLYIKAGFQPKENTEGEKSVFESKKTTNIQFKQESLEMFFLAFNKRESVRKSFFIKSFLLDPINIEPLLFLFKESLCNFEELHELIMKIPHKNLKKTIVDLLTQKTVEEPVICPLQLFSCVVNVFFIKKENKNILLNDSLDLDSQFCSIFRSTASNLAFFLNSEIFYFSLGVYYIVKKRQKEALKSLYKSIEINKNFGMGHLMAGIAHSKLRETETAITFLVNASSIMDSSFMPFYCLGCQYQIMNNIQIAKHHYRESLNKFREKVEISVEFTSVERTMKGKNEEIENIDRSKDLIFSDKIKKLKFDETSKDINFNEKIKKSKYEENNENLAIYLKTLDDSNRIYREKIIDGFIYCLIYNELYTEAFQVIEEYKVKNVLGVFCNLFAGNLEESKKELEYCEHNCKYFATKGFIMHITEDFKLAIECYERSLLDRKNKVIENLLLMAQENYLSVKENKAYDYTNCLFESLGYNEMIV